MQVGSSGNKVEIAEIAAVSVLGGSAIQLRLLDRESREWTVRLPLDVLDASLRRLSADRALALSAETREDHARLTYPKRAWRLSHDPGRPELTFSCRTDDGCGLEIGFDIDPLTAIPTLAVTVATG
jgi:hypothetical protein